MNDSLQPPHSASAPLGAELRVALQAAVAAGKLLLDEFNRPEGPRGERDTAPVDQEAEDLVAALLTAAFPDDGFLGEETGSREGRSGRIWVVDPNDGTRAYLGGHRGPSVSIGLLDHGVPVLGVVNAYAAPDGAGDLVAGAMGQGLTRNGAPVAPRPPSPAPQSAVVLVPLSGLRAPEAVAAAIQPMRFRSVPSIAYRLALAAVGDGDAALSLARLSSWDVAAGHALIRVAGGALRTADGPFEYTADGAGTSYGCFAGDPATVTALAALPWRQRKLPPVPERRHPRHEPDPGILARAQGCWLGQLAGDALGSLVEFKAAPDIRRLFPPSGPRRLIDGGVWATLAGQATDDSEMALALARTLVTEGTWKAPAVHAAYRRWAHSGPFDMGRTTAAALRLGQLDVTSEANGALMRVSPIGIAATHRGPEVAAAWARADAALTHPHVVAGDANAVFAATLAFAIRSGPSPADAYAFALRIAAELRVAESVQQTLVTAGAAPPDDFMRFSGWVLKALHNAFYQLLHAPSLEDGVAASAAAGGDTDTNAAIAGALLGAVHGRAQVPAQWLRMVTSCRPCRETGPHVVHVRPAEYWPADALELAECLVRL